MRHTSHLLLLLALAFGHLISALHILEGAAHGGPEFSDPTRYELVKDFFARHIKKAGEEAK